MADAASRDRKILFAPAAGPGVGGGHVMRCLTLAEALRARGADCAFAVNETGGALAARFGGGFALYQEPLAGVLEQAAFDTLVIDDYALSAANEAPLRRQVRRLAVIDDLADRTHLADLLIDSGYGREATDYRSLLPFDARVLVGPAFAPLRPAFAASRPAALAQPVAAEPRRLFVSFGLSDVGGVAARAVAAIRARFATIEIDVALASDAQSLARLEARAAADPALRLHIDASNMAPLMAVADLAVGAGGASTWERCCLGLPTLAVIVADNQRRAIQGLAKVGALLAVELDDPAFETKLTVTLDHLWEPRMRAALRTASAAVCDGGGAARVADAILAL